MAQLRVRAARPTEAHLLSELALRSKGHWGYDAEFLRACQAELKLSPAEVRDGRFFVVESGRQLLGFYGLDGTPPDGELSNLWVDPGSIGSGLGRRMWQHAVAAAQQAGFAALSIDAEPFAEGFYRAMGAERVGVTESGSVPGRVLPRLRFRVPGADA